MERPLDIATSDRAGADFQELSPPSSSAESGGVAGPAAAAEAVAVIVSGEATADTGGAAPADGSKKRARGGERAGDEGDVQVLETPPVPSSDTTNAVNGEAALDQTSRAIDDGSAPSQVTTASAPQAKKPRRRKVAIAPASVDAAEAFPSIRPAPGDLPRADEILCALERQAALLERQARVQEEQNRLMQELLAFLSRRPRPSDSMPMVAPPPPGPTQMQ